MQVAIVHGYFLSDSGSGIYVRELCRELVRQGHDVTLVCQEPQAEAHDFIDEAYDVTAGRTGPIRFRATYVRRRHGPRGSPGRPEGFCRLLRPDIGGRLLAYVGGTFPGFGESYAFQDAPQGWIDDYIDANVAVLTAVLEQWSQELVIANHVIMQPYVVRRALELDAMGSLEPRTPYLVVVHGSALNFSVKKDPRLARYALEGLQGARAVAALSPTSVDDVVTWAAGQGLDIADKTLEVPPGVDIRMFRPEKRASALEWVAGGSAGGASYDPIDPARDDVIVLAGRLLRTKGAHYAVAAMPLLLVARPRAHLLLVGEGPMRPGLERLIQALDMGDLDAVRLLIERDGELEPARDYGPVIPEMDPEQEAAYLAAARGRLARRVRFTGHVDHERLAHIFGAADLAVAPSVFPEAFALVSAEALAAGVLPLATYQSGLSCAMEQVSECLSDASFLALVPPVELTRGLAAYATRLLDAYPTKDPAFRRRLHELAGRCFSWEVAARRLLESGGDGRLGMSGWA